MWPSAYVDTETVSGCGAGSGAEPLSRSGAGSGRSNIAQSTLPK